MEQIEGYNDELFSKVDMFTENMLALGVEKEELPAFFFEFFASLGNLYFSDDPDNENQEFVEFLKTTEKLITDYRAEFKNS